MATIHTWMTVHGPGCENRDPHEECDDGRDVAHIYVAARFEPEPEMTLRDRIRLARTAALFAARAGRGRVRR